MATRPSEEARPPQPLDDVMLAMDVVDTLRRRERLVSQELDSEGRAESLMQRLRTIYAQQGIEVPEHILEEGVAALKQDRFTYKPPGEGFATRLARLYVTRNRWGKLALGALVAILVLLASIQYVFVAPTAAFPGRLADAHEQAARLAVTSHARTTVDQLLSVGEAALSNDDNEGAKRAIEGLGTLRLVLVQEYTLRIVNRPGERSGVWRVPDVNAQARNYYIIVEAIDATGEAVAVPITSEETGTTETVKSWGLRVDAATFNAVAEDKNDNGIIENIQVGEKSRGHLRPAYTLRTTGGAITRW